MNDLIGFGILFILLCVAIGLFGLLCYSFWFRLIAGIAFIWWIWASVTPANETLAWIGTAIVGLAMISPWLIVIGIGGALLGYFLSKR